MTDPAATSPNALSRRAFLALAALAAGAAHLALAGRALAADRRASPWAPAGAVVAREPFGALERVAEGVWALVSTPFAGDRTTLSNGGLVAGRDGVLAVEGFNQPAGARWLAERARELTGRWPTHVVVTHYHADHANGLAGYRDADARCAVHGTAATRDAALRNAPADPSREAALRDAVILPGDADTALDLGGRTVRVRPFAAHTASDVAVLVDDAEVAFGGDLLWNGIFPNYVDATPSRLGAAARALRRDGRGRFVPGHGPVGRAPDVDRYLALLDEAERAARAAHAAGLPATDAAAAFALPASLGEWTLFSRAFHDRAFAAWYRELGAR
ncbi:MBL fold metallo-hydrolase [Roseisolibacter sp. H3M3-2]|uniref:MBL fold metallo-hydrolase n=1 Tax=Roseisolibacter sp. H3M3-2 TaxID=3031323 RepID=UPI0023DAA416|nr:MBL fold metallo-hydrolase [Roseisolibacter sp. H3M3-2]MDF1503664.1 MBL fold metallo-hydrolase [Roseisolibacter sp. H3M3-2]